MFDPPVAPGSVTPTGNVSLAQRADFGVNVVPMPDLGPMPRESKTASAWWTLELLHRRERSDHVVIIPDLRPEIEAPESDFFLQAQTARFLDSTTKVEGVAEGVAGGWRAADARKSRWRTRLTNRPYRIDTAANAAMWRLFNAAAALELT